MLLICSLALLLAHVTLRVLDPVAAMNPEWCEESLPTAVQRLMGILSGTNLPTLDRPYKVDLWFSCCLPLIKAMVGVNNTYGNTDKIIQILISISSLHSSDDEVIVMLVHVHFMLYLYAVS